MIVSPDGVLVKGGCRGNAIKVKLSCVLAQALSKNDSFISMLFKSVPRRRYDHFLAKLRTFRHEKVSSDCAIAIQRAEVSRLVLHPIGAVNPATREQRSAIS